MCKWSWNMQVYSFKSASELRAPIFFLQNLNVRNCVQLILPGARFYSTDRSCTSFKYVAGKCQKTQTNKQKHKSVEIKQRNSSICSVYLSFIKRLALGFPIQQSLESLDAKMLLLWYWKMQIIQCISLYVCCSDLADLLQDRYRIKSI